VSTLLITDLDGTLGNSDAEISRGLSLLAKASVRATMCILTGRSLNSLRPFTNVMRPGTLVSPWGGGNILEFTGHDFVSATPRAVVRHVHGPDAPHYIAIPRVPRITVDDEVHLRPGQKALRLDVVAGYWRFNAGEGDTALQFAQARGLAVSHGRDCIWVNLGPVPAPRMHTLRQCRAHVRAQRVVYLGDSASDAECIDEANCFFVPRDSVLIGAPGVTPFSDVDSLLRNHLAVL